MKSVKISDGLHDSIKKYCLFNSIGVSGFVEQAILENPRLKAFIKKLGTWKLNNGK